jgi:hypothetical protein
MVKSDKRNNKYEGFEQGPIRPPSEAASLLIRITRNCPWNRCTFCPVYKDASFELRPIEHIIKDIDTVYDQVNNLQKLASDTGTLRHSDISPLTLSLNNHERMALNAAINWIRAGMRSVFLQDANSLIIKPSDLVTILNHLKEKFPLIDRITSYARSRTICRISDDDLSKIAKAGLNRIHIGMESGSDKVLHLIKKGTDKAGHVQAGLKVKKAGMELSEYVMPGLGGVEYSHEHALETADALNKINPDFIRLRTLALPGNVPLHQDWIMGVFTKMSETEVVREILLFLENLKGITSTLTSDHILNLFEEIKGTFPEDKEKMTSVAKRFLELSAEEQVVYQVGRRTGIFSRLEELFNPVKHAQAQKHCQELQITPGNIDEAMDELMKRFI